MFIHNIIISILLFFTASISNAEPVIEAVNNTEHACDLTVHSSVPPYTAAQISINLKALIPNNDAQEALHQGIQEDSEEKITQAIQAGADANRSKEEKSPLLWAVLLKKPYAVECLLQHGAIPSEQLIKYAIMLKDLKSALLMAQKLKIPYNHTYQLSKNDNVTLLEMAFQKTDYKIFLQIMRSGIDLNENISGSTIQNRVLHFIANAPYIDQQCNSGSAHYLMALEMLQELINQGCNPNDFWVNQATYTLFQAEDALAIQLLLNNGANPNHFFKDLCDKEATWTPLAAAIVCSPHISVISTLINAGADINMKTGSSSTINGSCFGSHLIQELRTPLELAIGLGRDDIVKILLGSVNQISSEPNKSSRKV